MSWFKSSPPLESKEYRSLHSDLLALERKHERLNTEVEQLKLRFHSLQGKFYQSKPREEPKEPEDSNTDILIAV